MEHQMALSIEGPGIALYSPGMVTGIRVGSDFLNTQFVRPGDIGRHVRAGDVTAFCTGSPGTYRLRFLEGYPDEAADDAYPIALRLGLRVRGGEVRVVDLFWLSRFPGRVPPEQVLPLADGCYHLTVMTRRPVSGRWGDDQEILLYFQPLPEMPRLTWQGAPLLFPQEYW